MKKTVTTKIRISILRETSTSSHERAVNFFSDISEAGALEKFREMFLDVVGEQNCGVVQVRDIINDLFLSIRANNILTTNCLEWTVEELEVACKPETSYFKNLKHFPNCGRITCAEISRELNEWRLACQKKQ